MKTNNELKSSSGVDTTGAMTTKKPTKEENIIVIRYKFKADIQRDAAESGRSMSSYINWVLRNRKKLGNPPREDREEG